MISPSTAALVISVARGVIKFGQRLDALRTEKQVVEADLALAMPQVYAGPSKLKKVRELKKYAADIQASGSASVLGKKRHDELTEELKNKKPDEELVDECYDLLFPEAETTAMLSPDTLYVQTLREKFTDFDLSDTDCVAAAFYISAGKDTRQIGIGGRVGLLVADVIAEFGAENTALFVRDAGVRRVVQITLEKFAQPELEKFDAWSPLLRHAMNTTLNGLLDARGSLVADSQWLVSLMDALVEARDDANGGDDFLLGLFQGRGYSLLVGKGLGRAAEVLAEDQSSTFKGLAADLLKTAAPLVKQDKNFSDFFSGHWGDLLRSGLGSLERHGPALLKDQPELLRDVLVGMVTQLKDIPQANLLSNETLVRLGDAAVAAVAANPKLLTERVGDKPWLHALMNSFVTTMARDGVRLSFSREGLEEIVSDAASVFAEHPELIIDSKNAGLMREVVGGILVAVKDLPSLDARKIATAAASGTLRAFATHPGLVDTRYAALIAEFSGQLADCVGKRTLTGLDASAIASAAVETLLNNPALFDAAQSNLATATLQAVLAAARTDPAALLSGQTLVSTIREVLAAQAKFGLARLQDAVVEDATEQLTEVIQDALIEVTDELGRRVDLQGVPLVIGGLVAAWARGDFEKIDPESPAFQALLTRLLEKATA